MANTRLNQLDLFVAPFQRHSHTSREAAIAIAPKAIPLQLQVLKAIQACGWHGATDEELQSALKLNPSTERPRRIELVTKNLIADSGRQRKTKSGRNAVVWRIRLAGESNAGI